MRVELYDPHPGFAGALVPLEGKLVAAVDSLSGAVMELKKAENTIKIIAEAVYGSSCEVVSTDNCIILKIYEKQSYPRHTFRVLKYKNFDESLPIKEVANLLSSELKNHKNVQTIGIGKDKLIIYTLKKPTKDLTEIKEFHGYPVETHKMGRMAPLGRV